MPGAGPQTNARFDEHILLLTRVAALLLVGERKSVRFPYPLLVGERKSVRFPYPRPKYGQVLLQYFVCNTAR